MKSPFGVAFAIVCAVNAQSGSFKQLKNTDACVHGGSCNLRKVLNKSPGELSTLCLADPSCECHNERWLKSNCSDLATSKGTTLYVKVHPTPPTPKPPPTPPPPPTPAPTQGEVSPIWPQPQESTTSGPMVQLASSFNIVSDMRSKVVSEAISRYSSWITPPAAPFPAMASLRELTVVVNDVSEELGSSTNYSYSIDIVTEQASYPSTGIAAVTATATCSSVYAVVYALDSFAQLAAEGNGTLAHSQVKIRDYPRYKHRGLLLDIGRRFYPLPLLRSIIDGLAFTKMNVLHFHMSDFPAFRIKSKAFPELTKAEESQGESLNNVSDYNVPQTMFPVLL